MLNCSSNTYDLFTESSLNLPNSFNRSKGVQLHLVLSVLRGKKKKTMETFWSRCTVRMLSPAGSSRNDDATIRTRVSGGCLPSG